MLDAWIINQTQRQQERRQQERPTISIPLYNEPPPGWQPPKKPDEPKRGVVIIPLLGDDE